VLFTALRVLARCWPALLVWFLAGAAARALIIRLAAFVGNGDDIFGLLILPLAILVQLAAYIGMFLAIRSELPHLNRVDDLEPGEAVPPRRRRWRETLLAGILPFFLLYVAWNFIYDDKIDYFSSALNQADLLDGGRVASLASFGVMSVTLVIVAFALRWALGRFSAKLPQWSSAIATYLEAIWVFVALTVIQDLLAGVPGWLASRRMFAWAVDGWAGLVDSFAWLRALNEIVGFAVEQAGTLIGLPLAWLAIASIVYFATIPRRTRAAPPAVAKVSERLSRMPVWARRIGTTVSAGLVDRWGPVALAARLIWRSGPIALGTYLLGFAVVTAAGQWLSLMIYRILGPHETAWWFGASDAVQLGVSAVVAVLQVSLVAAAFDHALRSDEAEQLIDEAGDAVSSAVAPAADQPTS
jgi:hypothetical protein